MTFESIFNADEGPDVSKTIIDDLGIDFPRYRSSYVLDYNGVIRDMEQENELHYKHKLKGYENRLFLYVHTRQGYDGEAEYEGDDDYNETIRENENCLVDYKDDFDPTYRNFVFKIPEELVTKYKLTEMKKEEPFHLTPTIIEAFVDCLVRDMKEKSN